MSWLFKKCTRGNKQKKRMVVQGTQMLNNLDMSNNNPRTNVDLEEAMEIAGTGRYQLLHCAMMVTALCSAIMEMIGYQFTLTAGGCELELPESLRGLITSIPNIGIILTAPFWGRAADHFGRKPVMIVCTAACGTVGLLAAFMPNLISFGVCKLIGALFMSIPTSLSFAYTGEMVPKKRRDLAVIGVNGVFTLSTTLSPLLAWAVLSVDWQFYLGSLSMRPWRLLTIVYALPLMLLALWLTQALESPKFLMDKGRKEEALEVLRTIYAKNTGMPKESYGVLSLKHSEEESLGGVIDAKQVRKQKGGAIILVKPPHLKWFALTSFLMFGLYTSLNGLFLFASDTINTVLNEPSGPHDSLCEIINRPQNETSVCVDTITQDTFIIMSATTGIYGVVVMLTSIAPLSKKTMLVGMYVTIGVSCLLAELVTNTVVAGIAMSALQMTALGIGPLTAYTVQLFPTSVRGTAVGAVLLCGRIGSVTGANVAGTMLPVACALTFYLFAGLLFLCAALTFLLP